jgi:hypothetical protein
MHIDVSSSPPRVEEPRLEPADAPPIEALRATRIAGQVARELYENGSELRFSVVPMDRGRVMALLCDADGLVLSRLTPSGVLDIAAGGPLRGDSR